MKSEHTPGPWVTARTNEGEGYVLSVRHQAGGAQHAISAVWDDSNMALGEGIANARLIAAAPCGLKANERAERFLAGLLDDQIVDDASEVLAELRAAIAKARGE